MPRRRPAELLGRCRSFLRRPGGRLLLSPSPCPGRPGCARDDIAVARDEPADLRRALPTVTRTAPGRVLRGLDAQFLRSTLPDPDPPAERWAHWRGRPRARWHRRLYEDT
ncbi:hypothetical protein [Streptomyces sp. NRRL F-2580]|uniref:hypothetical protein n=1 Tax=Streptomyces sp. NRRL F-2580 TaxID=1463841 RepID=UPI000691D036|nr:hypothetical protein [Streptomyces sp. NRRL F-2580]